MNEYDILDIIGDAKGSYVWDAQQVRSGQSAMQRKRPAVSRVWLIAAVVALMLLLMGCAWLVMNLQELKVGEFHFTDYHSDESNHLVSTENKANDLISLQNTHQQAMSEWLEFLETYDPDGSLLAANDSNESGIPEPYHLIYHCYTWDMVEKLDALTEKYSLQLLSKDVDLQHYEHQVLFDALKINSLFVKDAPVSIDYGSSYFYPEGTFDADFMITLAHGPVCEDIPISIRYSMKAYFDPVIGSISKDCTQWNYSRADGIQLLLVMTGDSAWIFADLSDAFVSIQVGTSRLKEPMTQELLEQISEYFDLSIQPQQASMEEITHLLEKVRLDYEAEQASKLDAYYNNGYTAFVASELERVQNSHNPKTIQYMTYTLYDINSDGTEELITRTHGSLTAIVSTRDGESFLYYSPVDLPALPVIYICENNVVEIYDSYSGSHYYFKANADGLSFIVGLITKDNLWFCTHVTPTGDERKWDMGNITAAEVNSIITSYRRLEVEWTPIEEFPME